jgi:phosphatidylethanolamine-binding protein (PEBP) family uncharacterized protein
MVLSVGFAGCGGSSGSSVKAPPPTIAFRSPGVNAKGAVLTSYKCNESGIWLPLRWGALPVGTKELAIYVARFGAPEIKAGGVVSAGIAAQELIVGVTPARHGLEPGKVPHGVLLGRFEAGKKKAPICPGKLPTAGIIFTIYALPHSQNIQKGSQGGSNLIGKLQSEAIGYGSFTATYGSGPIVVKGK